MEPVRRFFQEGAAVVAALVRPAARSVRQNSGLAVLSVVLAFGLWIFVTDAENPTKTRVLPVDIPVQAVNVPAEIAVANELGSVRVRVRVTEDVFDSLTAADFEATADLDGLAVGEYELPVEVRPLTSRGGLRIEEVLPPKIVVSLVLLVSVEVPVVADVQGSPPSGFTMSRPEAEDTTVVVAGPREKVDLVKQVIASVDVSGRTESLEQAVRLEPRDGRGNLVQGVVLDPMITNVSIAIDQTKFSRPLVVIPEVAGKPATGYNVLGVSVKPATVTVSGSREFIGGAESIKTKEVNIEGKEKDVVKSVSLDLPRDASVIGGVNVTVSVRIAPAPGEMTFGVPVTATGLGDGLGIAGGLPTAQVTVYGPLPTLFKLNPSDLVATIDLKEKDEGTHKLKVQVSVPNGLEARAVTPQEIEVVLEKR